MITESATVLEVRGDVALVRTRAQAGCQRCAEGRGCGGDVMSRLLGDRLRTVQVATGGHALAPGDEVEIGLHERALVQASAAMYLLPLVTALLAAVAAAGMLGGTDGIVAVAALAGLGLGLVWTRRFGARRAGDDRFRPRVLARSFLSGSPGGSSG